MSQSNMQICIHLDVFDCLLDLPHKVQGKVKEFIRKFQRQPDSPGIRREKIQGAKHLYSVRIDQKYRGVTFNPPRSRVVILLYVGDHDDAYAWATRHTCQVNAVTGVLQVYSSVAVVPPDSVKPPANISPAPQTKGLLDTLQLRDRQVLRLGIPEELIPLARSINHEDDYDRLKDHFSQDAQDALCMLLAGYEYNQVLDELYQSHTSMRAIDSVSLTPSSSIHRKLGSDPRMPLGRPRDSSGDKAAPTISPLEADGSEKGPSDTEESAIDTQSQLEEIQYLVGYVGASVHPEESPSDMEEAAIDTDNIAAALARTGSRAHFWVVDDEEELKRMLDAPLDKWRIFLHPSQRRLVDKQWNGPVRVLGGAGTGKTVVAMHRARWLLQFHALEAESKILFLTFSANLAEDLKRNLRALIASEADFKRLEVIHLDSWVFRFLKQNQSSFRIMYDNAETHVLRDQAWIEAIQEYGTNLEFDQRFYEDEWRHVVLAQGAFSQAEYLRVQRTGRGAPLTRTKRAQIWKVFEAFRARLKASGYVEREDGFREARQIIEANGLRRPYASVIVDEAQDLGNEAFRLIQALAHPVPTDADAEPDLKNRLFIVGDAHQRIYGRHVVLGQCGIDIRGRSRRLRINYRTSEPVLKTAAAIMDGESVDDLNGGLDSLRGYRSLYGGPEPYYLSFNSFLEAVEGVVAWIENLRRNQSLNYGDFCLVARKNRTLDQWDEALQNNGLDAYRLRRNNPDTGDIDAVRLSTAHRVKGLEFFCVVILDADAGSYPDLKHKPLEAGASVVQQWQQGERALLHVAVSRAKRHLALCTTTGHFSSFLPLLP